MTSYLYNDYGGSIKNSWIIFVTLGVFLSLSVVTTGSAQQENADRSESKTLLEQVTVTTGAPVPGSPLDQPSQIDVVTGEELKREGGAGLGQSLDHIPGVDSVNTGNNVGKPSIRGLTGTQIQVISDGIGVDHQQFGTRHSPNIEPFLSGSLEVVRGPASIQYGSGAIGGAVNVQGLPIEFHDRDQRQTEYESLSGFKTNNAQFDAGLKFQSTGERWSFSGGVIDRSAGNIETPDEPTSSPPGPPSDKPRFTGELDHTDFDQTNAQIGVGHRHDDNEFHLRYRRWRNEHNFLHPSGKGIGQNLENDNLKLSGEIPWNSDIVLKPSVNWQNNLRQSNKVGNTRSQPFDGNIDVEFDQYTYRLQLEHPETPFSTFDEGQLGIEYTDKDQESRGKTQLTPGGEVTNLGLYAYEERSVHNWTFQFGLRHDNHENIGDEGKTSASTKFSGRDKNDYSVTTGSLGASYKVSDRLTLAGNVEEGFRAPTLFELYADGKHGGVAAVQKGNQDLDEEESLNTDLSLRYRTPGLKASATIYQNSIDDYIFLQDTGETDGSGTPIFRYNQANATLEGLELKLDRSLNDSLKVSAVYDLVNGENDDTDNDLPLLPSDEVRLSTTYTPETLALFKAPMAKLTVRHNASKDAAPGEPFQQFDNKPFGSASTDAYTVADLSFEFGLDRLLIEESRGTLKVNNLTDEDYRDFLDTYKGYALSPGRDVQFQVRIPFGS